MASYRHCKLLDAHLVAMQAILTAGADSVVLDGWSFRPQHDLRSAGGHQDPTPRTTAKDP